MTLISPSFLLLSNSVPGIPRKVIDLFILYLYFSSIADQDPSLAEGNSRGVGFKDDPENHAETDESEEGM